MDNGVLQFRITWLVIGWLLIFAVIYLSVVPTPPKLVEFNHIDKLAHFFVYALLMSYFPQLYKIRRHQFWIGLCLVFMGTCLEFIQLIGGVRQYELVDMIANSSGVVFGWMVSTMKRCNYLFLIEYIVLSKNSSSPK